MRLSRALLAIPVALLTRAPGAAGAESKEVRAAIQKGVAYLRSVQEIDGSFGAPRNVMFNESFATIGTYAAWTEATTGLCAMALLDCGESEADSKALDRALDYLLGHYDLKRISEWDTDNVWGYVYGLQALAHLLPAKRFASDPRRARMIEVGNALLERIARWQTPEGGWGYYEGPVVSIPNTWATEFTTAACVVGMLDAKAAGLKVDEKVLDKAIRCVEHAHLPTGAYTYDISAVSDPRRAEWIDNVKGSLGRIQVGNVVLARAGRLKLPDVAQGLDLFFQHHKFLAVGRKKPIPHESWYFVAAYFFLFGHYYASEAIDLLPPDQQQKYRPQLQQKLLEVQEPDGAFWDFHISDYTRAYGTAFGVMALQKTIADPVAH